jgi:hypothetical protein
MAESELGVLSSQCFTRRIPDKPSLQSQVAAWPDHRNKRHAKADWQFTTDEARLKLKMLYPRFERLGPVGVIVSKLDIEMTARACQSSRVTAIDVQRVYARVFSGRVTVENSVS